jgi:hypothetical protein
MGFRISTRMMQEQTKEISKKLGITGFECSRSWAAAFKARNGIVTTVLHGEKASADHAAAETFPHQFLEMIVRLGISNSNVYNSDESLFYPRLQSSRTICPERLAKILRGGKADRFRIGLMVTTCADGTNECPMLFSHTAEQPHGMPRWGYRKVADGIRASSNGTHMYYHTPNGWISRAVIAHYLTRILPEHIRAKAARNGNDDHRALLLLDGCGVHFTAMLSIYIAVGGDGGDGGDRAVAEGPVQINCDGFDAKLSDGNRPLTPRTAHQDRVMKAIRTHGADLTVGNVMLHVRTSLQTRLLCFNQQIKG